MEEGQKRGPKIKKSTLLQTKELLEQDMHIGDVAEKRGLSLSTVISHAEKLLGQGAHLNFDYLVPSKELLDVLREAVGEHTFEKLAPVRRYLETQGYELSYEELQKARLYMWSKELPK